MMMTNATAAKRISECIVEQTVNVLMPQIFGSTVEEVELFSWVQPRTVEQIVNVLVVMPRTHESCTLTGLEIRRLCCIAENLPL